MASLIDLTGLLSINPAIFDNPKSLLLFSQVLAPSCHYYLADNFVHNHTKFADF